MLNLSPTTDKVYIALGITDLRKSIDGLAAIVQQRFHLDPFSNCLFVCTLGIYYSGSQLSTYYYNIFVLHSLLHLYLIQHQSHF